MTNTVCLMSDLVWLHGEWPVVNGRARCTGVTGGQVDPGPALDRDRGEPSRCCRNTCALSPATRSPARLWRLYPPPPGVRREPGLGGQLSNTHFHQLAAWSRLLSLLLDTDTPSPAVNHLLRARHRLHPCHLQHHR